MKKIDLIAIIKKNGLKPSSEREAALITASQYLGAYATILKDFIGFSFEVVGGFGQGIYFKNLFNDERVISLMGKYIGTHFKNFDKDTFTLPRKIYSESKKEFEKAKKSADPERALRIILKFFPSFFAAIGVYNLFKRYLGNDLKDFDPMYVDKISKERDDMGKFYPLVEKYIVGLCLRIGAKKKCDGNLLKYFSMAEMLAFLDGSINFEMIKSEIRRRSEKYFYFFSPKTGEMITTDSTILEDIDKTFFKVDTNITELKGFVAYSGKVTGKVYNLSLHKKSDIPTISNFILVASETNPNDIILIKKCVAIVTNEGGILSHASIVSRELKVPCIIGTKIATKILKDGDEVEVDANVGVVKILK